MKEPVDWPTSRRLIKNTYNQMAEHLVDQFEDMDIEMDPPYQRGLVWAQPHKELLIDSMLQGISLPSLYIRELAPEQWAPGRKRLEMLDGKQRLNTITDFFRDRLLYKGWLFSEIPQRTQAILETFTVAVVQIEGLTDQEAASLYERINFSGVPHAR